MGKFNWTPKRKVALQCLIRTGGRVRRAAEESKNTIFPVSEGYLNDLKYQEKHKAFREEYRKQTALLLNALEVDTNYVLEGLVQLAEAGDKDSVRLGAFAKLGDYLGIWAPTKEEVTYHAPEIVEIRSDGEASDTTPDSKPASGTEGDMG